MKSRLKKAAAAFGLAAVLSAGFCGQAHAGTLNSAEASVLGAISAEYTVDGRTYRLADGLYGRAEGYLTRDGVDLTAEQGAMARSYLSSGDNIRALAEAGYFYATGDSEEAAAGDQPDTASSSQEGAAESGGGTTDSGKYGGSGQTDGPGKNGNPNQAEGPGKTSDPGQADGSGQTEGSGKARGSVEAGTVEAASGYGPDGNSGGSGSPGSEATAAGADLGAMDLFLAMLAGSEGGEAPEAKEERETRLSESVQRMADKEEERAREKGNKQKESYESVLAERPDAAAVQGTDPSGQGYGFLVEDVEAAGRILEKAGKALIAALCVVAAILLLAGGFRFQKKRPGKPGAARLLMQRAAGIVGGTVFALGLVSLVAGASVAAQAYPDRLVLDRIEDSGIFYTEYEAMLDEADGCLEEAGLPSGLCDSALGWQEFRSRARAATRKLMNGDSYDNGAAGLEAEIKELILDQGIVGKKAAGKLAKKIEGIYEEASGSMVGSFLWDFRQALAKSLRNPAILLAVQEALALFLLIWGSRYGHRAMRSLSRGLLFAAIALAAAAVAGYAARPDAWYSAAPENIYVFVRTSCANACYVALAGAAILGAASVPSRILSQRMKEKLLDD